jgi:CheY-like chemotaxis protein
MRKYHLTFPMALRVLLADESSTIKKVMQLALSDFAVEVKSVPIGFDVLPVAKNFKPDIVFADILLTKKSGYDVCHEIKSDPATAHIPVVLMWSGFMEVDQAKMSESQADGRLEKPFDADGLRQVVKDLVAKTKSNPISQFLTFPKLPDFEESIESPPAIDEDVQELFKIPERGPQDSFLKSNFKPALEPELPDEMMVINPEEDRDEGGWAHQDLSKFKLNIQLESEPTDFASKFVIPQEDDEHSHELSKARIKANGDFEEVSFPGLDGEIEEENPFEIKSDIQSKLDSKSGLHAKIEKSVKDQMMESLKKGPSAAQPKNQTQGDINADMMEKIVREEAREAIEAICWKILPEIAERLVNEEIKKILRHIEKSI